MQVGGVERKLLPQAEVSRAGCTCCPQLRLSEPLSVGQTHLLQGVEGSPVHPELPSPLLNGNPPYVSCTSLDRLPSLPVRGFSLSF